MVGERTGRELLDMRILDVGVHTWDLAVAIGADVHLDESVVASALSTTVPSDGESDRRTPQERLLLRTGRHPEKERT